MKTNIEILSEKDIPEKHLLNNKDYIIGSGVWSDGKPFYALKEKKQRLTIPKVNEIEE